MFPHANYQGCKKMNFNHYNTEIDFLFYEINSFFVWKI